MAASNCTETTFYGHRAPQQRLASSELTDTVAVARPLSCMLRNSEQRAGAAARRATTSCCVQMQELQRRVIPTLSAGLAAKRAVCAGMARREPETISLVGHLCPRVTQRHDAVEDEPARGRVGVDGEIARPLELHLLARAVLHRGGLEGALEPLVERVRVEVAQKVAVLQDSTESRFREGPMERAGRSRADSPRGRRPARAW